MQNNEQSQQLAQLESIKKKIHKIKTQSEKLQNNIKICPFPPGITQTLQSLEPIKLRIPIEELCEKDIILEEQILWDFEDEFTNEELYTNLFIIVIDLLEEKYETAINKLTAFQAQKIIDNCVKQVKAAIEDHKKYQYMSDVLQLETYIDKNDSMINIHLSIQKVKETIQWDLGNAFHYIDEFAKSFCYENKLEIECALIIGNQMRDQIQKAFEKRYKLVANILDDSQEDIKSKLMSLLDYPSFEPYQPIKEMPTSNDLMIMFKKNIDFLPPELQLQYGYRPHLKQTMDLGVDQDDTKKFEKDFNKKSKYLDTSILQDIINKNKQN